MNCNTTHYRANSSSVPGDPTPKLLWKTDKAGVGFSGPAVVGNVLYTMGGREEKGAAKEREYAFALDVNQGGKELWATKIGPLFTFDSNVWGDGPRSTPTIDGDRLYCLGGQGELVCLLRDKGTVVWRKNLINDFGGQVMVHAAPLSWGYCESPLVDGEKLICCPGGPGGTMVALDKLSGKLLWRSKELTDQASDSSAVVAVIGGVKQYVQTSYKPGGGVAVAGIAANDGKLLWYGSLEKDIYAICASPLVQGDSVYITAGYEAGCDLFKIEKTGAGQFKAEPQYTSNKAKSLMKNEHGGVVLLDGFVYGFSDGFGWVCQDFATGKEKWIEKRAWRGKGSLTCADGHFYLYSDQGTVALVEATPKGWMEKSKFNLPALSVLGAGRPSHSAALVWTHPVVANGRLYLRDQELIYCYAVK